MNKELLKELCDLLEERAIDKKELVSFGFDSKVVEINDIIRPSALDFKKDEIVVEMDNLIVCIPIKDGFNITKMGDNMGYEYVISNGEVEIYIEVFGV